MVRIKGIDLQDNKNISVALTYIYGIGTSQANKVLEDTKIDPFKKVKDLTDDDIAKLRKELDDMLLEGDLRRRVKEDVKLKVEIGCYQGIRHRKKLPVRGQKTRSNARTVRGGKKAVVANKKKVS